MQGSNVRFNVENLHEQVADDLIRKIASRKLDVGTKLEPDTDLANSYGVSVGTLRRALNHVASLDLIDRRKGRHTTVLSVESAGRTSPFISTVDRNGDRVLGETMERNVRVETPTPEVSRKLRQRVVHPVLRFDRLRHHEGRCFMVEDVHLPARREDLEGSQDDLDQVARDLWLFREVVQSKTEKLWIEDQGDPDRTDLDLPADRSVLCIERVVFGARRMPLEYRIGRCNFGSNLFYTSG